MDLWKEYNLAHGEQPASKDEKDKNIKYRFILRAEKRYLHGNAKKLLDVGCGSGSLLELLKNKYEVAGIDKDQKSVSTARKVHPKLKFFRADMRSFRLKDRFDIITCVCAIDHGDDLRHDFPKTLKNMCSHLSKKGMIIFDMPFIHDTWGHDAHMDVSYRKTGGRRAKYIAIYQKAKGQKPHQGTGFSVIIRIKGKNISYVGKPYVLDNLLTIGQVQSAASRNRMKCYIYDDWTAKQAGQNPRLCSCL